MDEDEIRRLCRHYDFPLVGARHTGDILILTPKSLESLPETAALRELADALDDGDWAHVTFDIPEEDSP